MPTQSKRKRILPVFLTVLLIAAVTVATVYAYLKTSTPAVTNSFAADVDPDITITESFEDNVKSDVAVQVGDTGYSVYVRAAIVVTWKNAENGDVLATKPVAGVDYTIALNDSDWFEKDGFYYHKAAVPSEGTTANLIISCIPIVGQTPKDYALNVEIIAQAIQAKGTTDITDDTSELPAVNDAWGVYVDSNGKLSLSPTP